MISRLSFSLNLSVLKLLSMITVTILPALIILLHSFLLIRYCIDLFFRNEDSHFSFSWILFIFLVPLVGYYSYYKRYVAKT
jgi:hypothetical protein